MQMNTRSFMCKKRKQQRSYTSHAARKMNTAATESQTWSQRGMRQQQAAQQNAAQGLRLR
jgi:hypothetical protein